MNQTVRSKLSTFLDNGSNEAKEVRKLKTGGTNKLLSGQLSYRNSAFQTARERDSYAKKATSTGCVIPSLALKSDQLSMPKKSNADIEDKENSSARTNRVVDPHAFERQ